jgi:(p)ppGpp synthase/HD superfamily hydrolase
LASITSIIAQNDADIKNIKVQEKNGIAQSLSLLISLNNIQQLQVTIQQLHQLKYVSKIKRV